MHLDIHLSHWVKHTTIRAVSLMTLDVEEPLEQVLVGLYPKDGLAYKN